MNSMLGRPIVLSKSSGKPFYRQLAEELAERIRSGVLAAGDPLPSIREYAAELLVSVITVKGAYEELEAQGLIVSHQGRGTFVADGAKVASKKHFEDQVSSEFLLAAQRAERVAVGEERVCKLAFEAIRKTFKKKEQR